MTCPQLPVLLYHRIRSGGGASSNTPGQFLAHMRYLAENGYQTLSGEKFSACALGKIALPKKAVLITFDYGYASEYTHAYPVLKNLGMNAITFLITGKVGEGEPRHDVLASATEIEPYLRWSEIGEMVSSGVFEAHCHSHRHVKWHITYAHPAEHLRAVEEDITISRQKFKEFIGGIGPRHLAWPWGFSTPDTRAIANNLGFDFQYTVKNDFNTRATPLDHINRLCMDGNSLSMFVARLEFFRKPSLRLIYPPVLRQYHYWTKRLLKG